MSFKDLCSFLRKLDEEGQRIVAGLQASAANCALMLGLPRIPF